MLMRSMIMYVCAWIGSEACSGGRTRLTTIRIGSNAAALVSRPRSLRAIEKSFGCGCHHWSGRSGWCNSVILWYVVPKRLLSRSDNSMWGTKSTCSVAVLAEREEIIKTLISRGASITHQDIDDETPYDVASEALRKVIFDEFEKQNGEGSAKWVLALDE